MVPLLSYSNDCLVASISWRLKGPTSNFYPHYSFSQILVLMHQCFLLRFCEAFCLFFVLGFASPQRFILFCCLFSFPFPLLPFSFSSLHFFFSSHLQASSLYFFVACWFATLPHLGSSCVTRAFDFSNHHYLFTSLLLTTFILAITIWSCCFHFVPHAPAINIVSLSLCLHMLLHQ